MQLRMTITVVLSLTGAAFFAGADEITIDGKYYGNVHVRDMGQLYAVRGLDDASIQIVNKARASEVRVEADEGVRAKMLQAWRDKLAANIVNSQDKEEDGAKEKPKVLRYRGRPTPLALQDLAGVKSHPLQRTSVPGNFPKHGKEARERRFPHSQRSGNISAVRGASGMRGGSALGGGMMGGGMRGGGMMGGGMMGGGMGGGMMGGGMMGGGMMGGGGGVGNISNISQLFYLISPEECGELPNSAYSRNQVQR